MENKNKKLTLIFFILLSAIDIFLLWLVFSEKMGISAIYYKIAIIFLLLILLSNFIVKITLLCMEISSSGR